MQKKSLKCYVITFSLLIMCQPLLASNTNTQKTGWFTWTALIGATVTAAWATYAYVTVSKELEAFKQEARKNRLVQQKIDQANEQLRLAMENVATVPEQLSMQRTASALRDGANVNSRFRSNQFFMPALWFAIDAGKPQVVETLIDARADVNATIDTRILDTNNHIDRFIKDSNFFGASSLLFWAIHKENQARIHNSRQTAERYVSVAQLLIQNGVHCPPDLPAYLRPALPVPQQHNSMPNYTFTQYSAISDHMSSVLIERQSKPMQQRHTLLFAAPQVNSVPQEAGDSKKRGLISNLFSKQEPQN